MTDSRADVAAMRRLLDLTGLAYPRGVLGPEAMDLATTLARVDPDPALVETLVRRVAAAQWIGLQGPMNAALTRVGTPDDPSDARALDQACAFAEHADPDNPLSLALAERAGHDLASVRTRALDRLEALAVTQADGPERPDALVALATTAGRITADLLDLDPDDFAAEIAAYADVDTTAKDAMPVLVRATGDLEIRTWARDAIGSLDVPAPPLALASVRGLAAGEVPDDAVGDVLWTATIIVLAEQAIDMATAQATAGDGDDPSPEMDPVG